MTDSSIAQRVRKVVAHNLGIAEDFKNEANFINDLGADSLDIVELVMAFEEEFKCQIEDVDAEKIRTVEDVIAFLTPLSREQDQSASTPPSST